MALVLHISIVLATDRAGKSDPFLVLYRQNIDGTFSAFHETEVIQSNLNPKWKSFSLPASTICNGEVYRPLKVSLHYIGSLMRSD